MERTIVFDGSEYTYNLERKRVKNINLRIAPEKGIQVSAPKWVPIYEIENFMQDKKEFILGALATIPEKPVFDDKKSIRYLGKAYELRVLQGKHSGVHVMQEQLLILIKKDQDPEAVFEKWEREECERLATPIIKRLDEGRNPTVKYRKMTSRWGSCSKQKNEIILNTRLCREPIECIEYVVAHELTHFKQFNHSPKFYEELAKICPDWKERKGRLGKM